MTINVRASDALVQNVETLTDNHHGRGTKPFEALASLGCLRGHFVYGAHDIFHA